MSEQGPNLADALGCTGEHLQHVLDYLRALQGGAEIDPKELGEIVHTTANVTAAISSIRDLADRSSAS